MFDAFNVFDLRPCRPAQECGASRLLLAACGIPAAGIIRPGTVSDQLEPGRSWVAADDTRHCSAPDISGRAELDNHRHPVMTPHRGSGESSPT
jgi:hypothetical protein